MFNYGHERRALIVSVEKVNRLELKKGKKHIYRERDRKKKKLTRPTSLHI